MGLDFSGNSSGTFPDPFSNGLKGHTFCKTFLNLNTIIEGHMFVFSLINHFSLSLFSQTKCYHILLLKVNAIFKLHCCIYFEN